MEKNKIVHQADGITFASREEQEFHFWLLEAAEAGLIERFSYQPRSFELAPKVTIKETVTLKTRSREVERHLLHDCVYTPDFNFIPGRNFLLFPARTFQVSLGAVWIDVKGTWSPHNDDVKFSLLQKWMFQKHRVYVNKVIPGKLFDATFVPRRAAYAKNGQPRACYGVCRRIDEFCQIWR